MYNNQQVARVYTHDKIVFRQVSMSVYLIAGFRHVNSCPVAPDLFVYIQVYVPQLFCSSVLTIYFFF